MSKQNGTFHICIDATSYSKTGKGASRYTYELLSALYLLGSRDRVTVLARQEAVKPLRTAWPSWEIVGARITSSHAWYVLHLGRELRRIKPDLLHVLGEAAVGSMPVPFTMAVHELPGLSPSGSVSRTFKSRISRGYFRWAFPIACRRSAKLFALSNSTRNDLINAYDLSPEKILVTYPGIASGFFASNNDRNGMIASGPYLLMFATGDPREMPEAGLRAFAKTCSEGSYLLLVAGNCPTYLRARLESLGEALGIAERVRFLGYVDDDDLASLYAQCVIFMELTRYEGFGLQVGEAMAAGAPIIATNIPAIREVVGTTEWLVDIADIDSSLPLRISVLLNDAGRRTRVAEAGRERAATFKWERTAKVTWDGLHGVLQEASCE